MSVLSAARTLGNETGWTYSNLPMQKILYIGQMIHLGRFKKPMFEDHFEAWDHGPVAPALYHTVKRFGRAPITDIFTQDLFTTGSAEWQSLCDAITLTRHMSDGQLVAYTHHPGGAWEQCYHRGTTSSLIPISLIYADWRKLMMPSDEAVTWAEEMASQREKTPARYLSDQDERAFRAKLHAAHIH